MNENNGILNINGAASRFCGVYSEFGTSLDKMGSEIYQLDSQMKEKAKQYNISDRITDFYSDNSITAESIYGTLSDSEKYHDDNGNIVEFDKLTYEEKATLEDRAKQMNAEQGDVKLELVTMRAAIDKKTAEFERFIRQSREKIRLANENFMNEKENLKNQKNRIQTQIDSYEYEIKKTKLDPAITNKSQLIADFRRQIGVSNIRTAIINSVSRAADVYQTVFDGILSNISVDMYDKDETIALEDQYNQEMSIADSIQKLVDGFNIAKENYDRDKAKIAEIEKSIENFKNNYKNITNANTFIKNANLATKSIKDNIKKIEENNDIEKVKVDENGNAITEPVPTEEEQVQEETPIEQEQPPVEQEQPPVEQEQVQEEIPIEEEPAPIEEEPAPIEEEQYPVEQEQTRQEIANIRQDPAYNRVLRQRASKASKRHFVGTVSALTAFAAMGLGFSPAIVGGAAALFGLATAASVRSTIATGIHRTATKIKLMKIAKYMKEYGLPGFKLGKPDYENGTINFVMGDDDEHKMIVNSSNLGEYDPAALDILNDLLAREFKNDSRGLTRKPVTKRELDLGSLPKVTVDNLEAAYAATGGVRSFKDDVLGSSFKTTADWIDRKKDALFEKIRDNIGTVKDVSYEEIEEPELPMAEEEEAQIQSIEVPDAEVPKDEYDDMMHSLDEEQSETEERTTTEDVVPEVEEEDDIDLSALVDELDENEKEVLEDALSEGRSRTR